MKNEQVLESIAEGSALIAEFLGWKLCNCGNTPQHYKYGEPNWMVCNIHDLKFNTSWDWLMPVVEKIHLSKTYRPHWSRDKEVGVEIEIRPLFCKIELPDTSQGYDYVNGEWEADPLFSMLNANYGTTIECTYNSVVSYVKWFNSCGGAIDSKTLH